MQAHAAKQIANNRQENVFPMNDAIDFDCGIAINRISAWLQEELRLPCNDGFYMFAIGEHACAVQITPLENRSFRNISLERTRLVAQGDAAALEEFNRLFTLRFISAGG